jgi:AhpD family alkylhydroperoxidase
LIRADIELRRPAILQSGERVQIVSVETVIEVTMAMHDWNNYRNQVVTGVGEIGKLSPDTVRGYATLGGAGAKTGHFDGKTRELIALAVAVTLRCDGCITVHAAAAKKFGATEEELGEALGVAISVNAGAALVYSVRTHEAFRAAGAERET